MDTKLVLCPKCNTEVYPKIESVIDHGPHHQKESCPECGIWFRWVSKPKNKNKRKPNKYSPINFGIEHCEICGRYKNHLGEREVLEVHHKNPISEGGKDEKRNIWILCTPCHSMCGFLRRYLNHHLRHLYEALNG